jgi:hypothetical protein
VIVSASSLEKAENAKARSPNAENMFALKLDISVEQIFMQQCSGFKKNSANWMC